MFTQRSHDAITVTWKTRYFTSEHKASKTEVFEKVIPAAVFFNLCCMTYAKNCKNWSSSSSRLY